MLDIFLSQNIKYYSLCSTTLNGHCFYENFGVILDLRQIERKHLDIDRITEEIAYEPSVRTRGSEVIGI